MQKNKELCPDCGLMFSIGDWPLCPHGEPSRFWRSDAAPHSRERAVSYIHPVTGERRTPARADQAMPEVYRRQGYERQEIGNMGAFEKKHGVIHEASNYNRGNSEIGYREPEPKKAPQKVIDGLVRELKSVRVAGQI